jgi:hypothetical protein
VTGAADVRAWATAVRRFVEAAPGEAIAPVDEAITARLRRDTGGDGAFSRGRNLGRATTNVRRSNGEAEVTSAGSRAVWGILQGGTVAHVVRAAPGRYLATPSGPRRLVNVSGVSARHTFTEGAAAGIDDAERDIERRWAQLGS